MTVKETTITEGHVSEKLETRDLVLIAQCAAMMTVCSWISVPAAVPFTMQTFGVFMAIGLLGGKRGTAAVAVYLLLGAAGLPVFSGFTGGIGHIVGPTGGYPIGFMAALSRCVFPYIIPDIIKIALAAQLTRRLRPYVA